MSQPRPIHQLPPSLVNRIAAGEVIERPAAVVKELVENAIDAGSTDILVQVEDGGRELIRVIDNGHGIPADQLPLAWASHATSKLTSDEDLFRIATMGFRGEALASIGAVSQARILSRTPDDHAAYEIFNRGGAISDPQAAAGNVGTTIEVRNLFFNTPARRKFIKGSQTEFGYISEMMLRLALPYPNVHFTLQHNGRTSLELPATDEAARWLAAWPKEFHDQRLAIDVADAEIRLRGMVGLPELARPTQKYQFTFLNGRFIRDRYVIHALREAFRGLTEPGRHPAAVLMIELPPQDVDVNVHPTKIEVRFKDSGRIHALVRSGVREQLQAHDLTPSAVPMTSDADPGPRQEMREQLAAFFKQQLPGPAPLLPIPSPSQSTVLPLPPGEGGGEGERRETRAPATPAAWDFPRPAPIPVPQPAQQSTTSARESASPAIRPLPNPLPEGEGTKAKTPAIQLHNSYLVVQSDDGLVIIDQHALHERIMFEDLLARVMRGPLESQHLLIPQTFDASDRQIAMLEQISPLLARLGIEASAFGPGTVAVQAFPSFLSRLEPAQFVQELLERGEQELLDLHEEELLHEVLDMMACKAAVKAGDPLSPAEIEALLARRDLVERSSNCPHGRPTTLRLTLRELEKQFKRTGF
jgi:DNA mismatch repair protein MutL